MYLIKQYIIINRLINKLIYYIKISPANSSNIGKEISLYNYQIYKNLPNSNLQYTIKYQSFYYLINQLNLEYDLNISVNNISIINISHFFYKFNQKLYKLQKKYLYSYFRGYYINTLYLYSTNMDTKNITLCNSNLYFVLYDFNTEYLDYIYYNILQSVKYPAKIKYLKNTHSDKYSINDLTDTIPYKLVFLHKTKYYHNIIYKILSLLFTSIENDGYLNDVELDLYTLYTRLEVK
jgi:hypothetical protein